MKILYIITQADGGGAQNYTLELAKHFRGVIAAGNEAAQLFDAAGDFQLTTYTLEHLKRAINPVSDILAVWEIRELIKKLSPDIVHLNSTKAGILGSFASIGTKTKVVFTAHGFIFNEPLSWAVKSFYMSLEKTASAYRDFIITVSEADRISALRYNLISPEKIQTIHNGIGQIDFLQRDEARKALKLPPAPAPLPLGEGQGEGFKYKLIFVIVANFYKTKGLDVLIEAVSMLKDEIKNRCQFVVIGDGAERESLELGIRNYELEDNMMLAGKISEASRYLKAFDCLIMPSRKEGLPFALLEAMKAGLPIIASRVGGIPEALDDAGILVAPENPKELAEAIQLLLFDPSKQKELSQKALERSKIFTEEKMLAETERIYELVMKK